MKKKTSEKVKAYAVIDRYLAAHEKARAAIAVVKAQKPVFVAAADIVAGANDQIQIGGALIYRTERKAWDYPAAVVKATEKLEALKKAYEEKHAPASVTRCWAVKERA